MVTPLSPHALVYSLQSPGDAQISPDGASVAFTLAAASPETNKAGSQVWVCNVDGSGLRRLTWTGERNGSPRWSPDGRSIALFSDRVPASGLFILPMEGGEARELTRHPTAIDAPAWAPDGRYIAYTAPVDPANPEGTKPPEGSAPPVRVTSRVDYKQDNRGYLGDTRHQVFVVDAATGERRQLTGDPFDHGYPAWAPDGSRLAVRISNNNGMCSHLVLVDLNGGPMQPVSAESGVVTTWSWSPDGKLIVYSGDPDHTSQPDFYVYDLASKKTRRVTTDLPCQPDGGFPTVLAPSQPVCLDHGHVLFHAFHHGASGLWLLDLSNGEARQAEGELETRAGISVDATHRFAAQVAMSLERPPEVAVVDRSDGGRKLVTNLNSDLMRESPAARWERLEVTRGRFTTEAWLLLPADFDPAKRYPLVLDVHGGPNGHYGYGFVPMQQCLATNGLAVVFSNPRGSTSYGREFTTQVYGDWGGEDYLDLMAVVDRALDRPYLDADRTGIWGYSYGGYMTAWTISQTDRFKAAVCGAPCFDLESMFGTSDISHYFGRLQWTGAPHEAREWYSTHSPSSYAHNTRTPTLIVHGEADERCPIGQGEQMFVALKAAGCEVEFARYPGGSHQFLRTGPSPHREDVLARTLAWFQRHLGGPE